MACILRVRSSWYYFSSTQYIVLIRRVQGMGREVGVFLKELKENSSTNLAEEGGYFNFKPPKYCCYCCCASMNNKNLTLG